MFGRIKKVFFTGIFGILYISFVGQLVYILGWMNTNMDLKLLALAVLSLEWLILISARYLSKKSSNNAQYNGYSGGHRR